MLFVATCTDKEGANALRLETRPAHLAYLTGLGAKVKAAGALLTPDRKTVIGSLLILEGDELADIEAMLKQDPYALAGLFAQVDVKPWRQAAGIGSPLD